MSFANKVNQWFKRKPVAEAAGAHGSMMEDTVVQDMYDGALNSVQGAPSLIGMDEDGRVEELVRLPLLGKGTVAKHQRTLFTVLGGSVLVLVVLSAWMLRDASNSNQQLAATGQALMQSQRLAKSVSLAMTGAAPAFNDVKDSSSVLARNVRALISGDSDLGVNAVSDSLQSDASGISMLTDRAEKSAALILTQQKTLTQVGEALRTINRQSSDLLETAETISSLKLQQGAGAAEIAAAGQLVMLTQRIGKSANEFQTLEGVSPSMPSGR